MANLDRYADCHASGTVRAAAFAVKEHRELTLCGHHVHVLREQIEAQGWTIIPTGVTKNEKPGVGTEATPAHFAL